MSKLLRRRMVGKILDAIEDAGPDIIVDLTIPEEEEQDEVLELFAELVGKIREALREEK